MNITEAHIHVERGVQRYNANVYDYFLPEDIDLILTKMQNRFIDSKFRRDKNDLGFQYDQGDLDDLESLIVSNFEIDSDQDFEREKAKIQLPYNYRYLIDAEGQGVKTCYSPSDPKYSLNSSENVTEYLYTLSFSDASLPQLENEAFKNLKMVFDSTTLFDINNFPSIAGGLPSTEDKYLVINLILGELRNSLLNINLKGVYWERYKDLYRPDSFILVSTSSSASDVTLSSGDTQNPSIVFALLSTNTLKVSTSTESLYKCKLRITNNDRKGQVLFDNAFSKSIPRSPVTTLAGKSLIVNVDKRFTVKRIYIDYIRIPQNISLSLGRGFELREQTHERICDLAIEYIKNIIEQPSYKETLSDNMLRSE